MISSLCNGQIFFHYDDDVDRGIAWKEKRGMGKRDCKDRNAGEKEKE
jgi:hypothetical protein